MREADSRLKEADTIAYDLRPTRRGAERGRGGPGTMRVAKTESDDKEKGREARTSSARRPAPVDGTRRRADRLAGRQGGVDRRGVGETPSRPPRSRPSSSLNCGRVRRRAVTKEEASKERRRHGARPRNSE